MNMLSDRSNRTLFLLAVAINISTWLGVVFLFPRGQTISPLHYTIYFGIDLTGRWFGVIWLPVIGTVAAVTHLLFARLVDHLIWRRLWLILALTVNLLVVTDLAMLIYFIRYSSG